MGLDGFGKNLFPASAPDSIAAYDAFDLAQGVGYVNYYGGDVDTASGGIVYKLSTIPFYSHNIASFGALQASATEWDFNTSGAFMIEFQRPQHIGGRAIINVPICPQTNDAASNKPMGLAVVSVWKVDEVGGQTMLYPRTSGGIVTGSLGSSGFASRMTAIPVNIPSTHFKIGDSLRLDVEGWSASNGGDSARVWIGHDPENRTSSGSWVSGDSILTFQVPYKIDIS